MSLSQIQGGGGLLILNSNSNAPQNNSSQPVSVANFVCNTRKTDTRNGHLVLKQEIMDTNQSSCCHTKENKMNQRETKMEVNENMRQSLFEGHMYRHQTEVIMSSAPSTPSKHMDTSHEESTMEEYKHQNFGNTVVLLGENNTNHKGDSSVINGGFFNETLDLSQEDIQRTLSANMPLCSRDAKDSHQKPAPPQQTLPQEINPMDFIDSCDVVVSPTHVVDDDVFVNLDAFDMLGEFPDLEALDGTHNNLLDINPSTRHHEKTHNVEQQQQQQQPQNQHSMEGSAKITDYSPEWAYPEGGVKVLVTGPWHSSGPYTVLFDTFPVPTTLVQSGVLRCYCPGNLKHLLLLFTVSIA